MIDLHMHTNYSDGTDTTEELLIKAETKKLDIISITDHDSVEVYKDLEKSNIRKLFKGKIIVGIEIKTFYKGVPVEVLGYGIDYKKIKVHKNDTYNIQIDSLKELKKRARKLNLTFDENVTVSKTDPRRRFASHIMAKEFLKYTENKKILLSIGPDFDADSFYRVHTSNKNSIFYYDESDYGITLQEAIDTIHKCGGIAVLAHPLVYPFEDKLKTIEEMLNNYDLDGLECEYSLFSIEERESLKNIAFKYKKYITGGTDYHGKIKPHIEMGTGINRNVSIPKNFIEEWITKIKTI